MIDRCRTEEPTLVQFGARRAAACHLVKAAAVAAPPASTAPADV